MNAKNIAAKTKSDLNAAIADVAKVAPDYTDDIRSFTRNRKLTIETVIRLLLTMTGGALAKELHAAGVDVTPSAFVQRRHKISPIAFHRVLQNFNARSSDVELYRGYRLFAVDGTSVNLAYNPDAESFLKVSTHPKGGYNALHVTPLYDLMNSTYHSCIIQPKSRFDEQGALIQMLHTNRFSEKALFLADRGFESYNIFSHLIAAHNVDFIIRIRQGKGAMRDVAKLPMTELDTDVSLVLSTRQVKAHRDAGYILMQQSNNGGHRHRARWDFGHINPYPMNFRVVRIMLDTGEYETIATSLDRDAFSADEIKQLYGRRWGAETSFKTLKYALNLLLLHGKSDKFAMQEVYAALAMYNFCHRIARAVVVEQKQENIYEYRVNMTHAIYLCKQFFRDPHGDPAKLVLDIAKHTEPVRPGRRDERNIKTKGFVTFTYRVAA